MKKTKYTYIAIATLLALSSCKEDMQIEGVDSNESRAITLQAKLPVVSESRGEEAGSENGVDYVQVTAFENDAATPYLENERFRKRTDSYYHPIKVTNCLWPERQGTMEFYAHYPQLDAFVGEGKYSVDTVKVPSDISMHIDFMAAKVKADIPAVGAKINPVGLNLRHQLSRVQIKATTGSNDTYSFEIAGIRIGNPVVEGKYAYSTDFSDGSPVGSWVLPENPVKHKVEYIFKEGDTAVKLGTEETNIMGLGGNAMVIPAEIAKWERPANPKAETSYKTDQMYFSVLLRAETKNNKEVYPYPNVTLYPEMKKIYFAVKDADNKILARLYRGINKEDYKTVAYFTDEAKQNKYELPEGASIKDFGWAAVPVGVKWDAEQSYCYTLDFSNGIGYHDPEDPAPGTSIEGSLMVTVKVLPWIDADALYTPDITVPYE